jgi:hypothetical protein
VVEVWPENHAVFMLFVLLQTQWRTGMGGPIGLDYMVLFHELDRMELSKPDYDNTLADIRLMESAALTEIHRKK